MSLTSQVHSILLPHETIDLSLSSVDLLVAVTVFHKIMAVDINPV